MRKVLFATTALATVAGAMAVANADVTVSGGVEWRYVAISDDVTEDNRTNDNTMVSNVDVTISFSETTDSGITMSASQNWDDGAAGTRTSSVSADFGTIEWSEGSGAAHASSAYTVTSPSTSGGVGDAAGPFTDAENRVLAASSTTMTALGVNLQANEATLREGENGALNYHSPNMGGFTFGVGTSHMGSSDADTSMSYGLKYAGAAGGVSYSVGYGDYEGKGDDEGTHVGFQASWDGITIGAGSSENTDASGNEEETVSYAATYAMSDALTVGVGMTDSENGDHSLENVQVGVVYTIAPGLTASLASNSFEYEDEADSGDNNEGTITQMELKMSF